MAHHMQSQLDPLPSDLPFRIISKTIGRGAYASIKKAIPPATTTPVFAVKFIHKAYAVKHGRISMKQIAMEVSLHSHIGQHPNIIEWFATGEDDVWKWIAMEYAEGGDLFDKIEADVGVSEDIAHFYFQQLISGVSFMHSKGVGHRDIKPENILLSDNGNLKIADFGLATLFEYDGRRKASTTMCGSPPYIAPEVISCSRSTQSRQKGAGYAPDLVDIWSCGVVLFVLLVGNTPWDEPTSNSWEFEEYGRSNGRSSDDLWKKVPTEALSLLRGMMSIDPEHRFKFSQVRRHPWVTRKNPLMTSDGRATDPVKLATQILENLHINFSQQPTSQLSQPDSMVLDDPNSLAAQYSATQPDAPISDFLFDLERPPMMGRHGVSASQPMSAADTSLGMSANSGRHGGIAFDALADEPSMSQFAPTPSVPMSLTQHARRFRDIVPSYSMTRFFSHLPLAQLLQLVTAALHTLNVPVPTHGQNTLGGGNIEAWLKIKTLDGRRCGLNGDILIEPYYVSALDQDLLEVRFVKVKGDPLEWRRFFKKVVVLCKEGVWTPET